MAKKTQILSADEAKAEAKKAFDSGKTNCPICNGIRWGTGFAHADACSAKFQRAAGTGERKAALEASLSDDDKETATELSQQYSKNILKYAATLAKKPKAVRITTGDLFSLAKSPEEMAMLQRLLKRQQTETETAKK